MTLQRGSGVTSTGNTYSEIGFFTPGLRALNILLWIVTPQKRMWDVPFCTDTRNSFFVFLFGRASCQQVLPRTRTGNRCLLEGNIRASSECVWTKPKAPPWSLRHLYPKEKGLTWTFHFTDNGGKAHEVKWFVLYHNLAAIKQDKSALVHVPRGKGNQVRPRGNQARGLNETPPLCLS